MRCKKHLSDLSSCVGVCATCLHDRLLPLTLDHLHSPPSLADHLIQPQILPPHSVSPYTSHRKLDNAPVSHHNLSDQRFDGTPQVVPTAGGANNKKSKWTLLSNLIRSASRFSISGHRKKQSRLFSVDQSNAGAAKRKGMSPERYTNGIAEGEFTGHLTETPKRAGRRPGHGRNLSGMVICLSPLVRTSPNRNWYSKGISPETAVTGELRVKPHLAASFHGNRSRKIADFGRFNLNR
ncbi:hypothetical protein LguiB_011091 [Lonicera macranthoides]